MTGKWRYHLLLAGLACAGLLACPGCAPKQKPPSGEAKDRVQLDVGDRSTREWIQEGFSVDEVEGSTTFARSDQVESLLLLPLSLARPEPYVLGLRARALDPLSPSSWSWGVVFVSLRIPPCAVPRTVVVTEVIR